MTSREKRWNKIVTNVNTFLRKSDEYVQECIDKGEPVSEELTSIREGLRSISTKYYNSSEEEWTHMPEILAFRAFRPDPDAGEI